LYIFMFIVYDSKFLGSKNNRFSDCI
jgi:hypothetical protein